MSGYYTQELEKLRSLVDDLDRRGTCAVVQDITDEQFGQEHAFMVGYLAESVRTMLAAHDVEVPA